jgi:phosphoribosylformylglycinamidine synthase
VSLYNETKGEGIYPTPVIGVVGILEDVSKAVPADFQHEGLYILLLRPKALSRSYTSRELGSSEFVRAALRKSWGAPPALNLTQEASLHRFLKKLADSRLVQSARAVADGGLLTAISEACFARDIGALVDLTPNCDNGDVIAAFGEAASSILLSASDAQMTGLMLTVQEHEDLECVILGTTRGDRLKVLRSVGEQSETLVDEQISELKKSWSGSLQSTLSVDTVTA